MISSAVFACNCVRKPLRFDLLGPGCRPAQLPGADPGQLVGRMRGDLGGGRGRAGHGAARVFGDRRVTCEVP